MTEHKWICTLSLKTRPMLIVRTTSSEIRICLLLLPPWPHNFSANGGPPYLRGHMEQEAEGVVLLSCCVAFCAEFPFLKIPHFAIPS